MKSHILPLFLLILLIFAGCIQEPSIEQRLLCIDLSTPSQPKVPDCTTQESCLAKVESSFSTEDAMLSFEIRQMMHIYKNHVARSWLYFNRAQKNLSKINSICSSPDNFNGLNQQTNELNHNLSEAFAAIDGAGKTSFAIILLEKQILEEQDINLIREEPLFNDYTEFVNNENEILYRSNPEGSSYAAKYLKATELFTEVSKILGFEDRVIEEVTVYDMVFGVDKILFEQIPKEIKDFPLMKEFFNNSVNFFSDSLSIDHAVSFLQHFPSFELLNSFNEMVGTENSSAKKFFELMNSANRNLKEMEERNNSIQQEVESTFPELEKELNSLNSSALNSFDKDFLAELYSLLGQESEISVQSHSIDEISSFVENAQRERSELLHRFGEWKVSDLSIGERTKELKEIHFELKKTEESARFFSTEVVSGLELLCDSRTEFIGKEIDSAAYLDEELSFLGDLRASISFGLKTYNSRKETNEKLFSCREILEEFGRFKLGLEDREAFENSLDEDIAACLSSVENMLAQEESGLNDFRPIYDSLVSVERPYENPNYMLESCSFLRGNIEREIGGREITSSTETERVIEADLSRAVIEKRIEITSLKKIPSLQMSTGLNNFPRIAKETIAVYFHGKKISHWTENDKLLFELGNVLEKDEVLIYYSVANPIDYSFSLVLMEQTDFNSFNYFYSLSLINRLEHHVLKNSKIMVDFPLSGAAYSIKLFTSAGKNIDFDALANRKLSFTSPELFPEQEVQAYLSFSVNDFSSHWEEVIEGVKDELQNLKMHSDGKISAEAKMLEEKFNELTGSIDLKSASSLRGMDELLKEIYSLESKADENDKMKLSFQIVQGEVSNAMENLAEKINSLREIGNDADANEMESRLEEAQNLFEISQSGKSLDLNLAFGKLLQARDLVSTIGQINFEGAESEGNDLNKSLETELKKEAEEINSRINSFKQLIGEKIPASIASLRKMLKNSPAEELKSIGYIVPFTEQRLDKLELLLQEIDSPEIAGLISEFGKSYGKGDFASAVEVFGKSKNKFEDAIEKSNAINSELDSYFNKLKKDAVIFFNSAVEKVDESTATEEMKQLFDDARNELEKENYLSSIGLVGMATAPVTGLQFPEIPLSVLPLLAIIAAVAYFKFFRKKKNGSENRLKKVLRER
ncbi:MAG: hypothetical protein ABID38_05050 [Candidatus Diapherotrites archaeon]